MVLSQSEVSPSASGRPSLEMECCFCMPRYQLTNFFILAHTNADSPTCISAFQGSSHGFRIASWCSVGVPCRVHIVHDRSRAQFSHEAIDQCPVATTCLSLRSFFLFYFFKHRRDIGTALLSRRLQDQIPAAAAAFR